MEKKERKGFIITITHSFHRRSGHAAAAATAEAATVEYDTDLSLPLLRLLVTAAAKVSSPPPTTQLPFKP